ncbi:hypothetical protein HPB49_019513 [Dermacentor silvarum]|uniref:Uncharacterized protein n=1 Tax=Dermacentor silvarum TaxID=543639 RepID=A0ACB8CB04_DERSI|nr:hypothetical protein HPB49_019513 [Dermacentor silvarum]
MFSTLRPMASLRVVRLPQLLIAAALLSIGFSETVTQPTHEDLRESINSPMPYGFKYEAYGDDGGGHTREESADGQRPRGRLGYLRRVFYEADENGFRARVETNEPGTKTSNPADVTIVHNAARQDHVTGCRGHDRECALVSRMHHVHCGCLPAIRRGAKDMRTYGKRMGAALKRRFVMPLRCGASGGKPLRPSRARAGIGVNPGFWKTSSGLSGSVSASIMPPVPFDFSRDDSFKAEEVSLVSSAVTAPNEVPETTTGLPPGYVLPERYRPNASRRPSGAELLTSRILTLDQPVDGDQVYPGRPGFESDTNALNPPPPGIHTGSPPAGIVPVGPVQVTRVPSRPGAARGPRPRPHINYAPSKDAFGQFDGGVAQSGGPYRPSFEGSFRIPAGSTGGIFSPSQVAPKSGVSGPQDLGPSAGHGGGVEDGSSGLGSKPAFPNAGAPQGAGPHDFGPRRPSPKYPGVFRGDFGTGQSGPSGPASQGGAGQQGQPPALGAPLFTRVTQDSGKFPGRVDYGSQPGFSGPVQPGVPGAPGVFAGPAGGARPSFGGRAPFGGPRFGPGGSFAGVPVNQFGGDEPGDERFYGPGQPSFAGGQVSNQGSPLGAGGVIGADVDGGNSADSSNEDGFAPNDPRRPFLFRNEDERPATPVGPSTRGGAGQEDGAYAIQADNGKIQSVDFRPGGRPFRPAGPGNRVAGNRDNVPRGPFRRPGFGATRRDDPFRPYKPPPLESGHREPVFVPQSFSGPGSPTTSFDGRDPQRIDGFRSPQQNPGFGGPNSPGGFSGNYPYRNTFSSGGRQPPTGEQDRYAGRPQQPFSPFANRRPVSPVPAVANVANFPNPRNHFANRLFDRTPAGTLGRPVGHPPGLNPPSLVSMEVIRYGPQGPQVHHFNGSALPGSFVPPENRQFGDPFKPTGVPGSPQRIPFLANRRVPRPPSPTRGNANRVLYSEAPQQATFPRRLGEPKGNEEDFGGAFEGLIRDERPDLLELKRQQKPSGSASSQPGGNLDFLDDLLPFYEKDLDIGNKANNAANGGDRKPIIHQPIVPEHRDLLCDDDDPRFSDPRQPSPDGLVRRPECIKTRKQEGGSSSEGAEPDGKKVEAPVNADEEFLNYRNPFSGVLPSPDRGVPEKVDKDSKEFQRPFLDKDKKVVPVLIDQNLPATGVLDGTIAVNRNGLGPSTGASDIPDRSPPELGAGSPVEGRRAFGNNGVFRTNFGPFPGSSNEQFGPRGPGPAQGFGGPSTGKASPFAPRPQDGNFLRSPSGPNRGINDLRNAQDPFNGNFQPFGQQPFQPTLPQQTLRFGQRLSGVRNPNSLVPSQRPPRVQTRVQQQPESRIFFPPPPLHRKAVLSAPDGPDSPGSSFNGQVPFNSPQSQGGSRLGQPTVGFVQPRAGGLGHVGAPQFGFVDSRRFQPGVGTQPGRDVVSGREDAGPDVDTKPQFVNDDSPPPASFSFSDAKKSPLVPSRPPLSAGRRKTFKGSSDDTGKRGQEQVAPETPVSAPGPDTANLLRKPLLEGNARLTEELDRRAPNAVPGPFNFVDTRRPLDIARQRVVQRRPQPFDSVRQPGGRPARVEGLALQGVPVDGSLDSGRQGGFSGAPEDPTRQLLPTSRPTGAVAGAVEGPALLIPQRGPVRQPVRTPQPILLNVERVPLGGTAVADDLISDKSPQDIQAFAQGQKLGQDISSQELLRRGVNSAGASDDGGREEDGEQQRVNPYSFGYSSYDGLGSKMSRHETKDDTGRVTGYYIVEDVDGRKRTVHYVADKDGFRATVHTNEQGTDNQDPANVKMRVENRMPHPPPTPRTPSPEKTSPSPTLGDDVDVPVLDAVDQSVKKS